MNRRKAEDGEDQEDQRPIKPADSTGDPNAHNMDPENMGEDDLIEDPPSETSTPPGPTSK